MKYDPNKIEKKGQGVGAKNKYQYGKAEDKSSKPKKYILDMFPYPSGSGLHVGHVEGYTATDILSRFYRSKGFNVLHPMGGDAFGLPAEVYALKHGIHPREAVKRNVKYFRSQLELMGFSYDGNRIIDTTDPEYFKGTQGIFLKLLEKGLAYESEMPVNYCPNCQAVLADEEVNNGKCFRCGETVERKNVKQGMLRITAYAERLLNDLESSGLPEKVKTMQRNGIGRSEGYEFSFKLEKFKEELKVFTTRLDTLFGLTYVVVSPEHPLLKTIVREDCKKDVEEYIRKASQKSDLDKQLGEKDKTGVFTGCYAINPANFEKVPVGVSDYVVMTYGTGAVMAVPSHDERDFEFAKKFNLDSRVVIKPVDGKKVEPYCGEGILVNSGPFTNTESQIARDKIAIFIGAKKKINYKLRDGVFSRQRFGGEPIPVIKCQKCGVVPLNEKDLPLTLPNVKSYKNSDDGLSPLAGIKSGVEVKCPKCGAKAKRETNTMPQGAGSCGYYLRFIDPKNKKSLVDLKKEKYGMPIDIYVGGSEHAVTHLIYARFGHKFLHDIGVVSGKEPFKRMLNQGIVLGENGEKMSKSLGNVVNPDDVVKEYGVDSLRLYEMFMGAFEDMKPGSTDNVMGVKRFLERVGNFYVNMKDEKEGKKIGMEEKEVLHKLEILRHKTIKKVSSDIENVKFNTAISSMMEYLNGIYEVNNMNFNIPKEHYKTFVILLSPFAPHISEEIGNVFLKNKKSIQIEKGPEFKEEMLEEKNITISVQINGKLRSTLEIEKGMEQDGVTKMALNLEKIQAHIPNGTPVKKIIFVKDRMINFVI